MLVPRSLLVVGGWLVASVDAARCEDEHDLPCIACTAYPFAAAVPSDATCTTTPASMHVAR